MAPSAPTAGARVRLMVQTQLQKALHHGQVATAAGGVKYVSSGGVGKPWVGAMLSWWPSGEMICVMQGSRLQCMTTAAASLPTFLFLMHDVWQLSQC